MSCSVVALQDECGRLPAQICPGGAQSGTGGTVSRIRPLQVVQGDAENRLAAGPLRGPIDVGLRAK